jgi:hypothetical protein
MYVFLLVPVGPRQLRKQHNRCTSEPPRQLDLNTFKKKRENPATTLLEAEIKVEEEEEEKEKDDEEAKDMAEKKAEETAEEWKPSRSIEMLVDTEAAGLSRDFVNVEMMEDEHSSSKNFSREQMKLEENQEEEFQRKVDEMEKRETEKGLDFMFMKTNDIDVDTSKEKSYLRAQEEEEKEASEDYSEDEMVEASTSGVKGVQSDGYDHKYVAVREGHSETETAEINRGNSVGSAAHEESENYGDGDFDSVSDKS